MKGPAAVDGQCKCTRGLEMFQWLLDICTAGSAQLANDGSETNTFPCVSTTEVYMDPGFFRTYKIEGQTYLQYYEVNLRVMSHVGI